MPAKHSSTSDFRILHEYKFVEIAPALASKREAVGYLLNQYSLAEARLLYIGDDVKDEEAFDPSSRPSVTC